MGDDEQKLQVSRNGRRRFEPASQNRLVGACLEPGVSVSRLALEHGVNPNLLHKWIKKRTEPQSLRPSSSQASIPVQIESTSDRALLRQSSMIAVWIRRRPVMKCVGRKPKGLRFFLSSQGGRVAAERCDTGMR